MQIGNRYSQHSFSQVPDVKIARSSFDRSFAIKDTFDFDYLIPVFVDEILPGDDMSVTVNTFARLATQKVPIMDNMYIDFFFFFVPNRLVWENWEKFNGAQDNPQDTTDYICPYMDTTAGGPEVGSIFDKFGHPTDIANSYRVNNTMPLRAYNLIWNEWFRDQNLQPSITVPMDDGPDVPGDFFLQKRNKRHDYFTSGLPWPQKGDALSLPISPLVVRTNNAPAVIAMVGGTNTVIPGTAVGAGYTATNPVASGTAGGLSYDPNGGLTVNVGTINELRQAFQIQSLLELDARAGTRYVEILQAHYGVISPDFRLQRPEYLGGGQQRINSHPVAQTSPTSGSNPQAQLAAFGTSSSLGSSIGFTKSFVEHGYVIGLACARADITYQQGLNRLWNRQTRYDFFWPKLQEIGEQAIENREIFVTGTADDLEPFAYAERYAEYRYKPSEIHGQFRSTYAQSLDFWHLAEDYTAPPVLNSVFIASLTPIERAIAVTDAPHLLFDAFFKVHHARPILAYSVPASLGRF